MDVSMMTQYLGEAINISGMRPDKLFQCMDQGEPEEVTWIWGPISVIMKTRDSSL